MSQNSYDVGEWLGHAEREREGLIAARNEMSQIRLRHDADSAEVEAQYWRARNELVQALLPVLDPQAIARAFALTAYIGFRDAGRLAAKDDERRAIQTRIAAIEADRRWIDRQLLAAPRIGTITRALAELQDFAAPLRAFVSRCEHPRLEHLQAVGYGTSRYAVAWWRMSYYLDWKAGDEILERFSDKKDFGEVLAELRPAVEALAVYDRRIIECERQLAEIDQLVRAHAAAEAELATLDARHLARARDDLGRHLDSIGLAHVGDRLSAEPDLDISAKRVAGLLSKGTYLKRMRDALDQDLTRLHQEIIKLERSIAKYRRPKNRYVTFDAPTFQKRFGRPRGPRYLHVVGRRENARAVVVRFDDYSRGSLAEDFLWWDLMTDGRLDGDFIPEVHTFRERHPSYRYEPAVGLDDSEAAVAVAKANDHLPGGFGDVS